MRKVTLNNQELIQGSNAWLEMRKKYVGASDSPVIMGVCKFKMNDGRIKTPYCLWEEKLGFTTNQTNNTSTQYGSRMEGPARLVYEKMTNNLVSPHVVFHPKINCMMASLDGLTIDGDLAVEIKNCNADDHECARKGKIPVHYIPQVMHQLECLGHDMMHYFSFHKGEGIVVEVYKDYFYQELLKSKIIEFWECVDSFVSPPLTSDDYSMKGSEWITASEDLYNCMQQMKSLKTQCDFLKENLKNLTGSESSIGGEFLYVKSWAKGRIDFDFIEELQGVDLEKYRKQPSEIWTLKKSKKGL